VVSLLRRQVVNLLRPEVVSLNRRGVVNLPVFSTPPGIYADYAYVLLQIGKTEEGKALLLKEIELYPESKIFIDRILKMLKQ
jgi:hypothetical protein